MAVIMKEIQFLHENSILRIAILVGIVGIIAGLYSEYQEYGLGYEILPLVLFIIIFIAFIARARLETEVRTDGLFVKLVPFHIRWKEIKLNDIESVNVVTYRPIRDYGGWGIRYGMKGKAYNAYGNRGIHIQFKNRKSLLIGSQKPDELLSHIKV